MAKNDSCDNNDRRFTDDNGIRWKINRVIEATAMDIHHIIGQKYRNEYNVHAKENKIKIPRRKHFAYNNFVEDKQNPREAFKILFELTKQVLSEWVRKELYTILYEAPDDLFYIPEVIKWKKQKKKKSEQSLKT